MIPLMGASNENPKDFNKNINWDVVEYLFSKGIPVKIFLKGLRQETAFQVQASQTCCNCYPSQKFIYDVSIRWHKRWTQKKQYTTHNGTFRKQENTNGSAD